MFFRISRLSSAFEGPALEARSVTGCGLPEVVIAPAAGWKGCRPRGVSAVMRKWPVKGGPMFEGRVSGSIYGIY